MRALFDGVVRGIAPSPDTQPHAPGGTGGKAASGPTGLSLGVVCPMANEAATAVVFVDAVLEELARFPFAAVVLFVVIDNVSRDATRELLERHRASRPELRVIWAPENRGVADAYIRGYREALAAHCDWILEIDAGFSHSPKDIERFVDEMSLGRDCVFGSRFMPGGRNFGSARRRAISRGGTALTNLLLGTRLSDMTSGFELFSRPALELALEKGIRSKGPFFQTELKAHCRHLDVGEVPIEYASGSHEVGSHAVAESLKNLWALFRDRIEQRR